MRVKKKILKKRAALVSIGTLLALSVFTLSFAWGTYTFYTVADRDTLTGAPAGYTQSAPEPFPVGVDPKSESIVERPNVESFYRTYVYTNGRGFSQSKNWLERFAHKIALMPWYQNLASLSSRTLVIYAGERKEEVAQNFARILKWSNEEQSLFLNLISSDNPEIPEGKFYPGRYVVGVDAGPEEVAQLVYERFVSEILTRYSSEVEMVVPIEDALTIASLLEREAYDFTDMRFISGIIWNRLFIGMPLQIDATLQYARASAVGGSWWAPPRPRDKSIDSPFNTYLYEGLPVFPIANPSIEAVLAALNPRITDCMYYFHDDNGGFHCSVTYKEHETLLKEYY